MFFLILQMLFYFFFFLSIKCLSGMCMDSPMGMRIRLRVQNPICQNRNEHLSGKKRNDHCKTNGERQRQEHCFWNTVHHKRWSKDSKDTEQNEQQRKRYFFARIIDGELFRLPHFQVLMNIFDCYRSLVD